MCCWRESTWVAVAPPVPKESEPKSRPILFHPKYAVQSLIMRNDSASSAADTRMKYGYKLECDEEKSVVVAPWPI